MLLVDDGEAEALEPHVVLDQRVGADREARDAGLDRFARRDLLLLLQAAREPRDRHAQRPDPFGELSKVLLGQDLGGRHQHRLVAGIDGLQRGDGGHHRFAAAHVALQQPLHRMRSHEIGFDLADHAGLRRRQHERQRVAKARDQRAACRQHRRGQRAARGVGPRQRQLLRQQLVELDPLPRRMAPRRERLERHVDRRSMDETQRSIDRR